MEYVLAWVVAFIVSAAPPGRTTFYAEAQETREESMSRYQDIARDVVEVVYDPGTKPLFQGPDGRARTASVVLAVMLHESGFMKNVDFGVGKYARGDRGNSWCMMQLNVGSGRTIKWNAKFDRPPAYTDDPADIVDGVTGPELVADRKVCIREGLKVLRMSFASCGGPLEHRLKAYASGTCSSGGDASAARMNTAIRWFTTSKDQRALFKDADIVAALAAKKPPAEAPAEGTGDTRTADVPSDSPPTP